VGGGPVGGGPVGGGPVSAGLVGGGPVGGGPVPGGGPVCVGPAALATHTRRSQPRTGRAGPPVAISRRSRAGVGLARRRRSWRRGWRGVGEGEAGASSRL